MLKYPFSVSASQGQVWAQTLTLCNPNLPPTGQAWAVSMPALLCSPPPPPRQVGLFYLAQVPGGWLPSSVSAC